MTSQPPVAALYCPVCGEVVQQLWVWQVTDGDRARVYCEACAARSEYASLARHERRLLDAGAFHYWAGQRMLRHVFEKEHSGA